MRIDLAARIDRQLAAGNGDGWRFAILPADVNAYRAGLKTLDREARAAHGKPFGVLTGEQQDRLLASAMAAKLIDDNSRSGTEIIPCVGARDEHLIEAEQLRLWLEDVRADAVKIYVSHPATLARMGYSGIADGGETETATGFVQIGVGEREAWEPHSGTTATQ